MKNYKNVLQNYPVVAVIEAGAATEAEMKDKKLRIEDALNATVRCCEEGIVAGGGTTFIDIIPALNTLKLLVMFKLVLTLLNGAVEEPLSSNRLQRWSLKVPL